METSLKTGFAQIFSCCPKNLSCPTRRRPLLKRSTKSRALTYSLLIRSSFSSLNGYFYKITWDQAQFSFRFVMTFVAVRENVWGPLKLGLISGYYKTKTLSITLIKNKYFNARQSVRSTILCYSRDLKWGLGFLVWPGLFYKDLILIISTPEKV